MRRSLRYVPLKLFMSRRRMPPVAGSRSMMQCRREAMSSLMTMSLSGARPSFTGWSPTSKKLCSRSETTMSRQPTAVPVMVRLASEVERDPSLEDVPAPREPAPRP